MKMIVTTLGIAALTGCTLAKNESKPATVNSQTVTIPSSGNPADAVSPPGVPTATVPTGPAMVLRVTNALEGMVNPNAGNFRTSVTALETNLPKVPNPLKATGADQGSLLAYAACADVPATNYAVNIGQSIAVQKPNIIAAGKRILDRCTAGLGSNSPAAAEVTAALTELVDKNATVAGETTEMVWISACYTAVTVCTQFLGI